MSWVNLTENLNPHYLKPFSEECKEKPPLSTLSSALQPSLTTKKIEVFERHETLLLEYADLILNKLVTQLIAKLWNEKELQEKLKINLKKDTDLEEILAKLSLHLTKELPPLDFEQWKEQDSLTQDFVWCAPDSDQFLSSLQELGDLLNLLASHELKNPQQLQNTYEKEIEHLILEAKTYSKQSKFKKALAIATLPFNVTTLSWIIRAAIKIHLAELILGRTSTKILLFLLRFLRIAF